MSEQLPLATLIALAQTKTDESTRRLGQLQTAHSGAAKKLEMLLQYRQDYLDQLDGQMRGGAKSAQVRNFQNFIDTLEGAIEQQRAVALQADARLVQGRTDWQHQKRRLTSFDTLAIRLRQQQAIVVHKKEQLENDERSARQFNLRFAALTE